MNYSTFNNNKIYIKQNSTLPKVKYRLIQSILEKYDITGDMLENVAVTFSMIDLETGLYKIANVPADLDINRNRPENPDEIEYTLSYRFKENQTKRMGMFKGEFVIDFMSNENCGKIKFPIDNDLIIIINPSITKTTLV